MCDLVLVCRTSTAREPRASFHTQFNPRIPPLRLGQHTAAYYYCIHNYPSMEPELFNMHARATHLASNKKGSLLLTHAEISYSLANAFIHLTWANLTSAMSSTRVYPTSRISIQSHGILKVWLPNHVPLGKNKPKESGYLPPNHRIHHIEHPGGKMRRRGGEGRGGDSFKSTLSFMSPRSFTRYEIVGSQRMMSLFDESEGASHHR